MAMLNNQRVKEPFSDWIQEASLFSLDSLPASAAELAMQMWPGRNPPKKGMTRKKWLVTG